MLLLSIFTMFLVLASTMTTTTFLITIAITAAVMMLPLFLTGTFLARLLFFFTSMLPLMLLPSFPSFVGVFVRR